MSCLENVTTVVNLVRGMIIDQLNICCTVLTLPETAQTSDVFVAAGGVVRWDTTFQMQGPSS